MCECLSAIRSLAPPVKGCGATRCKAPQRRWHIRQWRHFRIRNLQSLKSPGGFESHSLRNLHLRRPDFGRYLSERTDAGKPDRNIARPQTFSRTPEASIGLVRLSDTGSNPEPDSSLIPGRFSEEFGGLIVGQPDRGWAELAAAPFSHYLVEGAKHDPTGSQFALWLLVGPRFSSGQTRRTVYAQVLGGLAHGRRRTVFRSPARCRRRFLDEARARCSSGGRLSAVDYER